MDLIFTFLEYSWTQRVIIWVPQSCPSDTLNVYGWVDAERAVILKLSTRKWRVSIVLAPFRPQETCQIIIEHGLRVGLGNLKKRYLSYIRSNKTTVFRLPVRSLVTIPINLPHITKKYTNLFLCVLVSPCLEIWNMINKIYTTVYALFWHSYTLSFLCKSFQLCPHFILSFI